MQFATIIAPVDFSEKSEAAVEHAAGLARHFGSRLVLLHVLAPTPHEYRDFSTQGVTAAENILREQCSQATQRLQEMSRRAVAPEHVESVVVEGDPAGQIAKIVEERDAGLVVMPTHGRGRFRRMLLGSVTSKVLHDVACPVLTGTHMDDQADFRPAPYVRIACALRLRPIDRSERLLRWARDFAQSMNAPIDVIHVSPELALQGDEWLPNEMISELEKSAGEDLKRLVDKVGCNCQLHYKGTHVKEYVNQVVAENGCELVVVGRSEPDGLLGLADDNAFALIRRSPCPVMSV